MGYAILLLFAVILVLVGILLVLSPGKLAPLSDAQGNVIPGSISEKITVNINGWDQGLWIQSKDPSNPVLLFVHGGPGMPEHFLNERYPSGLENDFTMVWWDQRGAGLSYRPDLPAETMTFEQMIADTLSVTHYLRRRFGKEKIILLAHSWGSFIGIQAAARAPELYSAYIGMGQMTFQLESEMLAYRYMLAQYRANGNAKMAQKLEAAPPTLSGPLPAAYDAIRDDAMHALGIGTTRDMDSIITGVFLRSWASREYTLAEKVSLWRGKLFSRGLLRDQAFASDLRQIVTRLDLPVYFFHGRYDYTCSYPLARAYFDALQAPSKGFYTFEQSAHSPIFEAPGLVRQVLREDVLAQAHRLADQP